MLVAPVVAPITVVGFLTAVTATASTSLAELIAQLVSAPLWWLIAVAEEAASVPVAGIEVPDGVVGAALAAFSTAALLTALRFTVFRWLAAAVAMAALAMWTAHVLW